MQTSLQQQTQAPDPLARDTGESDPDTDVTVSTSTGHCRRLLFVTVKYSAPVTQNATVTLNSGMGAAWDTVWATIALVAAKDGVYTPDGKMTIADDDVIDVVAPAGGPGITSAIAIETEIA